MKNLITAILVLMLSACTSMVGRQVDLRSRYLCRAQDQVCKISDHNLTIEYSITRAADSCHISGQATPTKSIGYNFNVYSGAHFTLSIIGYGNKIIDQFGIAGGNGKLDNKIIFERDFKCPEFNASAMEYQFQAKG